MKLNSHEQEVIRDGRKKSVTKAIRAASKANARALSHVEWLVKLTSGTDRELAIELRNRLMVPMSCVIAELPGLTMSAKAANAEVSRQTLYEWKRNENRPTPKQAQKLALLTSIAAEHIMGRKR